MIAVIDYGAGNLRNVCKALEHVGGPLGAKIVLTVDAREIERADKVVLPGVGAFGDCQLGLKSRGLFEPMREFAHTGKPLLGICVGMQLLFNVGEEMGEWEGLGLIPGRIVKFEFGGLNLGTNSNLQTQTLKVPHIGWNQLTVRQPDHPLMRAVPDDGYAYFVHSYHAADVAPADVLAATDYGYDFPAVVAHNNIWGIQFHPEKSQDVGLQMLKNFVEFSVLDFGLPIAAASPTIENRQSRI